MKPKLLQLVILTSVAPKDLLSRIDVLFRLLCLFEALKVAPNAGHGLARRSLNSGSN